MLAVRRFLLLWLLMFWLGGFTFYAAVVVPIGTEVLGSPIEQGWITRKVTVWLNVAGAAALAGWAWDIAADPSRTRLHQRLRWLLWLLMVAGLVVLVVLHPWMNTLLEESDYSAARAAFVLLHRIYLWTSTVQWLIGIGLTFATVRTWSHAAAAPDAARHG